VWRGRDLGPIRAVPTPGVAEWGDAVRVSAAENDGAIQGSNVSHGVHGTWRRGNGWGVLGPVGSIPGPDIAGEFIRPGDAATVEKDDFADGVPGHGMADAGGRRVDGRFQLPFEAVPDPGVGEPMVGVASAEEHDLVSLGVVGHGAEGARRGAGGRISLGEGCAIPDEGLVGEASAGGAAEDDGLATRLVECGSVLEPRGGQAGQFGLAPV